jgi:hypothetical protein
MRGRLMDEREFDIAGMRDRMLSADALSRELGLSDTRCPHCDAQYLVTDQARFLCLNGCDLRVWELNRLRYGLAQAKQRLIDRGDW